MEQNTDTSQRGHKRKVEDSVNDGPSKKKKVKFSLISRHFLDLCEERIVDDDFGSHTKTMELSLHVERTYRGL